MGPACRCSAAPGPELSEEHRSPYSPVPEGGAGAPAGEDKGRRNGGGLAGGVVRDRKGESLSCRVRAHRVRVGDPSGFRIWGLGFGERGR